jgi:tRNA1(Val) A37 N6-methylase TrmN6
MQMDLTDDRLLGGRVVLRQPAQGYRVAIDPVLLAAAVPEASDGGVVLDAGSGTGAASLCLAARLPQARIIGIEREGASLALAAENCALNGFDSRVNFVHGDLAGVPADMIGAFGVVMSNPPFGAVGTRAPDDALARAHHESDLDLAGWIRGCLKCLRPEGRLVLVHRADRLSEILTVLRGPAGDIHILPILPKADVPAKRVIIDACKGRRSPDTLLPPLVLHAADGGFTAAAEAVLRDAQALSMR